MASVEYLKRLITLYTGRIWDIADFVIRKCNLGTGYDASICILKTYQSLTVVCFDMAFDVLSTLSMAESILTYPAGATFLGSATFRDPSRLILILFLSLFKAAE